MWPTTLFSLGLFEKLPCPLQTADMRHKSKTRVQSFHEKQQQGNPEHWCVPVVAEDEERPEHGALRGPVERPDEPAVEARGGRGEPQDDDDVAQHVGHGAPGVLDPAVLGDGSADLRQPERRRRPRVELPARGAAGRHVLVALPKGGAPLVLLDGGGEAGGRGDAERPVAVDGRGRGAARRRRCGERGGRRRRNGAPAGAQAQRREAAALGEHEPRHCRQRGGAGLRVDGPGLAPSLESTHRRRRRRWLARDLLRSGGWDGVWVYGGGRACQDRLIQEYTFYTAAREPEWRWGAGPGGTRCGGLGPGPALWWNAGMWVGPIGRTRVEEEEQLMHV
jgi:hypothetical protein